MATIRLCDWFKTRIEKDAPTFKVTVDDAEFEVSAAGKDAIIGQLEGENTPDVARVVYRDTPPPPLTVAPPGIDIVVPGDPFDPGPGSMPQPVQANSDDGDDDVPPLEIPELHPKKKLKMPTPAQADKVIEESTRFEEGGLPALTMGGKKQKEAMRKLREIEAKKQQELQRRAPGGVNIGDMRNKPGYN
ncbi:MAG: hypothetical protein ACXABY_03975 [Candidatus Thorarchaeota archaeon]|jgi:hypothetical protein